MEPQAQADSSKPRRLPYYAASTENLIRALNRLLTIVTMAASLVFIVRLTGKNEVTVSDVATVNVDWIVLALPAFTLLHWWLAGQAAGYLGLVQEEELKVAPEDSSSLLPRIPGLGWYSGGAVPREVSAAGRVVFGWNDPSIHVAVFSLAMGIAALMPWQLQSGHLSVTVPPLISLGMLGFVIVAAGLNWRIGAIWVSRVAELQLKPADRHLSMGGGGFYDPTDSVGPVHGLLVFSGAVLMYLGYSVLGGVLVGCLTESWAYGVLAGLAMVFAPIFRVWIR